MNDLFKQLLDKEVDRKEFLTHLGVGVMTIVGVTGVLKSLHMIGGPKRTTGYGSSSYGGAKRTTVSSTQVKRQLG